MSREAPAAAMLLALAAIWGSSFMFIKVGVRQLAPSTLVTGRLVLAAPDARVFVAALLGARGRGRAAGEHRLVRRRRAGELGRAVLAARLGRDAHRLGARRAPSGGAPLFTALLAFGFFASRGSRAPAPRRRVGFGGVALLVGRAAERARCSARSPSWRRLLLRDVVARRRPPPPHGPADVDRARDDHHRVGRRAPVRDRAGAASDAGLEGDRLGRRARRAGLASPMSSTSG